jgi:hypothetical protein
VIFAPAHGASPPASAAPRVAPKDPVLSAYAIGSGTGTITSSPAGISCDRSCTASFPTGTTVALTATPTNGSSIRYWSNGNCREQGTSLEPYKGPTCTFVMSTDRAVTVYFDPAPVLQLYFIGAGSGKVTSSPAGLSCAASCKAVFPTGTKVTLTATPKAGSAIRYWSNEICQEQGKSLNPYKGRTCTFVMDADRALTIYLDPAPSLFLYINGAGHVTSSPAGIACSESCKQSFPTGTTVKLTATPKAGSTVYSWSSEVCAEQGKSLNTYQGRTCTLVMDAERSVSISFVEPPRLEPAKAAPGPPAPAAGSGPGLAVGVSGDGTVVGSTPAGRIVCGARGSCATRSSKQEHGLGYGRCPLRRPSSSAGRAPAPGRTRRAR